MLGVSLELLVVLVLILGNGVFAMSELALVSAREVRLRQRAEEGDSGARAALELVGEPSRFLSTVQVGISLIAVFLGAFGGETLGPYLAAPLENVPVVGPYADAAALVVVVVAITYVSLVLGELAPKRLALNDPERISAIVARPMGLLSVAASPVVRLLSFSTDTVVRLLGAQTSTEPDITEEEIRRLIEQATSAGVLEAAERELVEQVFRLGDRRVGDLMTPRPQVSWVDANDPPEESWRAMSDSGHSNFPICDGNLDAVLGTVSIKDLWLQTTQGRRPDLQEAMHPSQLVLENAPALKVLETFREAGIHFAIVIDEYGGMQGVITAMDVLEAIVGDIPSPDEPPEPGSVRRADGSWLFAGAMPAEELKETLGLKELPGEERDDYRTVGGLVMTRLRRVPKEGEHFEWEGLRFEVVDMDGNRVDQVLVVPPPEEEPEEEGSPA